MSILCLPDVNCTQKLNELNELIDHSGLDQQTQKSCITFVQRWPLYKYCTDVLCLGGGVHRGESIENLTQSMPMNALVLTFKVKN